MINLGEKLTYTPVAIYFPDSDVLEYVVQDTFGVYDYFNSDFAVIKDTTAPDAKIVGFRLGNFSKLGSTVLSHNADNYKKALEEIVKFGHHSSPNFGWREFDNAVNKAKELLDEERPWHGG